MKTMLVGDLKPGDLIRLDGRMIQSDYMGKGEPKLPKKVTLKIVGWRTSKYSKFNSYNCVDDFGHEFAISDGLSVSVNNVYWSNK